MFVSISVTTYNRKAITKYCIDTIHERTPRNEYELIVVDNGSKDGTVGMLKKYKAEGVIDKLILNHSNSLGSAINDAWKKANPKADWLMVLSNDFFCMEGWFENLKLIISSELKPQYLFACLRMPGFESWIPYHTKNGGCFVRKRGKWKRGYPFGGGLVVRKSIVEKYKIKFAVIPFGYRRKSIYSTVCRRLHRMGLRFAALGKPCVLMHDCDFANPSYKSYYANRFGTDMEDFDAERRRQKLSFLEYKGYTEYPEDYYEGSDYEISPSYKKALKQIRGPDFIFMTIRIEA